MYISTKLNIGQTCYAMLDPNTVFRFEVCEISISSRIEDGVQAQVVTYSDALGTQFDEDCCATSAHGVFENFDYKSRLAAQAKDEAAKALEQAANPSYEPADDLL